MKLVLALTISFMFLKEHIVFGYLDPATGGGLIAFLVAILAGIAFYWKKIFYKIRSIFVKDKTEADNTDTENKKDK